MFQSIERFYYTHYLIQHLNPVNRLLHFVANLVIGMSLIHYFLFGNGLLTICVIVPGYSLALIGHLVFEKNRPVILKHPFMALSGDIWMFFRMAIGRIDEDVKRVQSTCIDSKLGVGSLRGTKQPRPFGVGSSLRRSIL